jgi:hypothetical protein
MMVMFDTSQGGWPLVDVDRRFWNKHKEQGYRVVKAPSYCYHLQAYSQESEQQKEVRHA